MLIHGVTITLINKQKTGIDEFGKDIYSESYEDVHDVLVAPVTSTQTGIPDTTYLEQKKKVLNLGIPKGDDHNWIDVEIIYNCERYRSVGFPVEGIEDLIPLGWHKIVTVEKYG